MCRKPSSIPIDKLTNQHRRSGPCTSCYRQLGRKGQSLTKLWAERNADRT